MKEFALRARLKQLSEALVAAKLSLFRSSYLLSQSILVVSLENYEAKDERKKDFRRREKRREKTRGRPSKTCCSLSLPAFDLCGHFVSPPRSFVRSAASTEHNTTVRLKISPAKALLFWLTDANGLKICS